MKKPLDDYLSLNQAADSLGVLPNTLRVAMRRESITADMSKGFPLFSVKEIERYRPRGRGKQLREKGKKLKMSLSQVAFTFDLQGGPVAQLQVIFDPCQRKATLLDPSKTKPDGVLLVKKTGVSFSAKDADTMARTWAAKQPAK